MVALSARNLRLVLSVLVVSCNCSQASTPCSHCRENEECIQSPPSGSGGGSTRSALCLRRCDAGCLAGHACTEIVVPDVCDPICSDALCPLGQACSFATGVCGNLTCASTGCADANDFCDTSARVCYPLTGSCGDDDDCPDLGGAALAVGRLKCEGGFCRLHPRPQPLLPFFVGKDELAVFQPTAGSVFVPSEDIELRWAPQPTAVLLLIVERLPSSFSELLEDAVWGGAAQRDVDRLRYSEGRTIINGEWSQSVMPLPQDTTLYLLVEAVMQDELVAVSAPVPFRIGSGWSDVGDLCGMDQSAACSNPAKDPPLVCRDGRCVAACASHKDCAPLACAPPDGGVRLCH